MTEQTYDFHEYANIYPLLDGAEFEWSRKALTTFIRRAWSDNADRQPCAICYKHQAITHQHHLLPVKKVVAAIIDHDPHISIDKLIAMPVLRVWLCPNHHALMHLAESHDKRIAQFDFTFDEYQNFHRLLRKRDEAWDDFETWLEYGNE